MKAPKPAISKLSAEQVAAIDVFTRSRGLGPWGRAQLIEIEAMSGRERARWLRALEQEMRHWPTPVSAALRLRLGRSLGEQAKIDTQNKGLLGRLGVGALFEKKDGRGLWVLLAGVVLLQIGFTIQRSGASIGLLLVVLAASAAMIWANQQRSLAALGTVGLRSDVLLEWAGWLADVEKQRQMIGAPKGVETYFSGWMDQLEAKKEREALARHLDHSEKTWGSGWKRSPGVRNKRNKTARELLDNTATKGWTKTEEGALSEKKQAPCAVAKPPRRL